MINWINGFNAGNKKEKYSLTFNPNGTVLRFMIMNLGFEI